MDQSSKDVLFTIAMKLDLPDLLRWCTSSSRINRDVCNNENVWRSKLLLDYPGYHKFDLKHFLSNERDFYAGNFIFIRY